MLIEPLSRRCCHHLPYPLCPRLGAGFVFCVIVRVRAITVAITIGTVAIIVTITATFAVARSVVRPVVGCPMTARLSA
jgi:hypothetical protein